MFKKIILVLGLIFILIPFTAKGQNTEQISLFKSQITVNTDASILIKEEIKYFFPDMRHGIYRYIPIRYLDKSTNKYFKTPITNLTVADEKNQPYLFTTSEDNTNLNVKIGDPDKTITGEHTYIISYKVIGVINYFDDHDEFYWNATGNGWDVSIKNVDISIQMPSAVQANSIQTKCFTGSTGSTEQNCQASSKQNPAKFSTAEGPLTIVLGWNKGVVPVLERQYEISWRHESGWYWLILPFTLIFMIFLYFLKGRDPFGRGTIAPEFEPPNKLLPAEMGTLIDEKAGNNDITATIIDLAVRGFLKIREKDKKYTLIKLKEADNNLRDYEKGIIEGIFAGKKEVKLANIYETFSSEKKAAKEMLYQDLINRKYFPSNPESIRGSYFLIGILIISFCGIFFWLSYNLVFALGFSGLVILIFAKFMSKKTKAGVIAKEKSLGFKEFLFRADRYKFKWQEKENIFEKYLPYALMFGITTQWAKNFEGIYKQPPDWYQGDFTTFSLVYFASSLNSFSSTANASYSPPASSGSSGFGGGGSSGGGFGGGGGGSW